MESKKADKTYVSILSQPEGRELRFIRAFFDVKGFVSILSQPEGRELL